MYDLIAKNKRRSNVLMILFFIIIIGLGWLLSELTDAGYIYIIVAAIFGVVSVISSYFAGDKMVLASVGAKQYKKENDPELYRLVENLAITAGVPTPKVYMIETDSLNAFATGRDPGHASVAITKGLRTLLTKNELEAVIGHELSHVKNYDIRLMLLTAVLVGMIIFMANILWRVAGSGSNRRKGNALVIPAIIIGLVGAPIAAQLIKLSISRKREYLADAGSVMLTRYPDAMISALQKISQAPQIPGHNEAIAHLFIYAPFKKQNTWAKLFSTHPPIEERITAIRKAAGVRL